jgi:hypothetical protein
MPRPKSNKENERLRRIVHEHLRRRSSSASSPIGAHLDEDALNAFIEGRLSETESAPVVKHLVSCNNCRHITAQLVRLEMEMAGKDTGATLQTEKPSHIRTFLSELAARVLPSSDEDVVFAYHAPADDFEKKDEAKDNSELEGEEKPPE